MQPKRNVPIVYKSWQKPAVGYPQAPHLRYVNRAANPEGYANGTPACQEYMPHYAPQDPSSLRQQQIKDTNPTVQESPDRSQRFTSDVKYGRAWYYNKARITKAPREDEGYWKSLLESEGK